ncbi:MAG: 6-bladed beta-propeller, partial [Nitrospirae bacterium]|nr:6-bladed beta-propeller [Nitrospirota bacterium]
LDSEGNIYVVDTLFEAVQIFNKKGQVLLVFGKPGTNNGEFILPSGIAIDNHDNVYVADSYNGRIQVFKYLKDIAH